MLLALTVLHCDDVLPYPPSLPQKTDCTDKQRRNCQTAAVRHTCCVSCLVTDNGYVTTVMIPIRRNTGNCAPNTRQRGRLSTRTHARRGPTLSRIIMLAGAVPVGQLVWGVHCRSSYHYDHITRTGSAAATTTSPRTPPTPPPSCQKGHTRTPHTPRTLSTFHLGGLQLCLLARRTTVGRFLSLRPGFPLWTSTRRTTLRENWGA